MKIEHLSGVDICENVSEIEMVMKKQNPQGYNEFWISIETQFPYIGVLTNNSLAYVHFFDKDRSPGLRALSDSNSDLDMTKETVFYSNNCSDIMEIHNECVITLDKAVEAVQEFFVTNKIPQCVRWDQL